MTTTLVVLAITLLAYLAVDVLASRWSGERALSLPTGCLVVSLVCAVTAHFIALWAAVVVFLLLVGMRVREAYLDRRKMRSGNPARQG